MVSCEKNVVVPHFIVKIINNYTNISYNNKRFENNICQSDPRG